MPTLLMILCVICALLQYAYGEMALAAVWIMFAANVSMHDTASRRLDNMAKWLESESRRIDNLAEWLAALSKK